MKRNKKNMNRNQRCSSYSNVVEPEYDVVDDQEELLCVRILPAMPIHDDREYADRDLPRSLSAQSLSSICNGKSNMFPRESSGPAINRDLKPGRTKNRLDKRFTPVLPWDQHSHRRSPSPPVELVNQRPEPSPREHCRRQGRRATNRADSSSQPKGLQHVFSSHTYPRHSLDLETHSIETRLQQNLERMSLQRHHHEWPQTREEQNDFVSMEKPQHTYCEEEWYVGSCSRADAEHALHLVNKDGAFLVRDCSINTNREPLVLAVYHEKKVYNVKIRFIESTGKYALGTGQRSNDMFDSVADIVKFHSIFPIILISGRNTPGISYPENCVLTCPIMKRDVDQLLQ